MCCTREVQRTMTAGDTASMVSWSRQATAVRMQATSRLTLHTAAML